MIVVVDGDTPHLRDRIEEIRANADAVLVADPRWDSAQRLAIDKLVTEDVPNDVAWATLTSGTSGSARVVLRTATSWETSFDSVAELLGAEPSDRIILPAPPASSMTLFSLAHAAAGGPKAALGLRAQGELFHGTPHHLRSVLDDGAPPSLRAALVGGSTLDPMLRTRAEALGIRVVHYYGAAELSFVAVDTGDGLSPFPTVDIEVRNGEVWVRSGFIASGYLGADGPMRRDGEWATVGDGGEIQQGLLRVTGRSDGAILTASATVVPTDVETELRAIGGVRDAVVFGVPHPRVGAIVAALVEIEPGQDPDVLTEARRRLAPAQRPRRWHYGEIPRTPSGKPAREAVLRRALNDHDR